MEKSLKRDSITPAKLLQLFEERPLERGWAGVQDRHAFSIPLLLPGEELILQQTNVTCVGTLSSIAKGILILTNYRLVFSGARSQGHGIEHLAQTNQRELIKRGYRYQKRKYQMPNVNRGIKKIHSYIGQSVKNKGRALQSSIKRKSQQVLFNRYNLEHDDIPDLESQDSNIDLLRIRLGTRLTVQNDENNETFDDSSQNVLITLPILSISEIRKYPKQYLEKEKLRLLRDGIEVLCNNLTSVRFCIGESDVSDVEELVSLLDSKCKIRDINAAFAYTYSNNVDLPMSCTGIVEDRSAPNFYRFSDEIARLKLNETHRLSIVAQTVCSSYPQDVIVPSCVNNENGLRNLAEYHTDNCFPVATWKSNKSGCFLFRSGMPLTARGLSDSRCEVDEKFLHELCALTASRDAKVLVFTDRARSLAASANNSQGGLSVAEGEAYYYPHCSLIFDDDLSDLQSVQQSGLKLMNALADKTDDAKYFSAIEDSGWLRQIQKLLEISKSVATAIGNDHSSVVVAFGQGTDRTAQIVSLAELLLDPFYRTLDGFQVLIQKEWLAFRHAFVMRNISRLSSEENLSPIFLQFLDCVWQIAHQFPTLFQFNDHLLEELALHSYSGRFGTFLDSKRSGKAQDEAISFWTLLNVISMSKDDITNPNYDENENTGVLYPVSSTPWLRIWNWHYRFKTEERLTLAADVASVQLEKLQTEYEEKFDHYRGFLQALSELDATYASRYTFHTRSSGSSVYKKSDFSKSDCFYPDYSMDPDWKPKNLLSSLFGKKSKSFDNLLTLRGLNDTKTGKSTFYDTAGDTKEDNATHIVRTFPRSGRLVSSQDNLRTELNDKGIQFIGVSEVQVTNKMCSGYLVKQGRVRKSWKRRWFVLDLRKGCVAYFFDHLSDQPKGVFKCITITRVHKHHNQEKHPNIFVIDTLERRYSIEAPNTSAMDVWVGCFQAISK